MLTQQSLEPGYYLIRFLSNSHTRLIANVVPEELYEQYFELLPAVMLEGAVPELALIGYKNQYKLRSEMGNTTATEKTTQGLCTLLPEESYFAASSYDWHKLRQNSICEGSEPLDLFNNWL